MGPTILFTHLKIILLQCFQFSVFSFKFSATISSIQTDPQSSITVVVRDWREKLVFSPHSEKVNTNVPPQADIEAIILALNIATKLNASHFVIESDEICIDSIRDPGDQVLWRLLSFVSAVNSIFIELGSISFSRVYHEENLAVHELAKWSCSHFYF